MTIKELSYLLLDMVNGGQPTDDTRINYRVARAYIRNAVAFQLRRRWWEEKSASDEHYVGKSASADQEVKYDEASETYYIETLGESIDAGGMRSYSITSNKPNSRWALKFVGITKAEKFNQRGLKNIPNVIQYYLDGDRIYFTNGDVGNLGTIKLSQYNLLPKDDDDSVPEDIGQEALNWAYRLAFAELSINQDRDNNGVPN